MSALPLSALLTTWLEAVRLGHAGPMQLADAVRGEAPRHLVVGLPGHGTLELHQLPSLVHGHASLALPVPGDLLGLGGPRALNDAALGAGEAVLVAGHGLVPEEDARTIVWRVHPADRVPWTDERETSTELRTALTLVTRQLVELDVAAWQPEIPDLLINLRHRPPAPLPPGYDPRRVETVERALLCLEIADLARTGEGGAVTAYEMDQRRRALADLDRASRRALVGACSALG